MKKEQQPDYSFMSLEEIRKDKGLSRAKLAEMIGNISTQTIRMVEKREQMPSIEVAVKMSRALGISLRQFVHSYGIDVSDLPME